MSSFSCSREIDLGPALLSGAGAYSIEVDSAEATVILSLELEVELKERVLKAKYVFASDRMVGCIDALVCITEGLGSIK